MQSITIDIPEPVFVALQRQAEDQRRTVQEVAQEVIATNISPENGLPPDLVAELAVLPRYSDAELWKTARARVSPLDGERLEEIHYHASARTLTVAERSEQQQLLAICNRVMLLRAKAAALLQERGHDISVLLQP